MLTLINGPFVGGVTVPQDPAAVQHGRIVFSDVQGVDAEIPPATVSVKSVLSGEEHYEIDGRSYRLTPDHLLLVDDGVAAVASVKRGMPTTGLCLYLPRPSPQEAPDLKFEHFGARAILVPSVVAPLSGTLRRVATQLKSGLHRVPDSAEIISLARYEICALSHAFVRRVDKLAGVRLSTRRDIVTRLERVRAFLHATTETPLSLAEMANHAGMSQFHFARSFSRAFGMAPAAYHTQIRLRHAAEQICSRRMTPAEACERLGFSEMRAFRRAFERVIGTPPSRIAEVTGETTPDLHPSQPSAAH